jgi:hypothetical protein
VKKLVVCTGWHEYGRQFLESFTAYWPEGVKLEICGEYDAMAATSARAGQLMLEGHLRHEVRFNLLEGIAGCAEFLKRHDDLISCGRAKLEGHNWKERAVLAGYNWRYDACKFSRQGFIPHHVALRHAGSAEFLCWLDGDVVTHTPIRSAAQITALMPDDKSIAYLGREPKHPDIAFQLYRLTDPRALGFLREFRLYYAADEVFALKEWHSAYVWRHVLGHSPIYPCDATSPTFEQIAHNLTPGGSGHVWHQSPLRLWGDHLKGERKKHGRSAERR